MSLAMILALIKSLAGGGGGGGGAVNDVKVNGTSVVNDGVANIPLASSSAPGVGKVSDDGIYGVRMLNGHIAIKSAPTNAIKTGTNGNQPITPMTQNEATFYGLAKAANADMKDISSTTVGVYPETQKSAIASMLDAPETVSGSTPSITAKPGVRYICGECSTLSITVPTSGCIDVVFESGSTATVLTLTPTKTGVTDIKWMGGFDPDNLDANTTYEINILDGEFGVVGSWT